MRDTGVTYGQLDQVLRALGFEVRVEAGKHRLYTHEATGALMSLPDRKPTESVHPTYLSATRTVFQNYDLADEVEFYALLKKANRSNGAVRRKQPRET
jgi:hypothetical protein